MAKSGYAADPLSMAYHPVLQQVQAEFPDCVVLAYLDDTYVLGPPARAYAATLRLQELAAKIGLESRMDKAEVYSPDPACPLEDVDPRIKGAPLHAQGRLRTLKVIGGFIGSDDAAADKLKALLLKKLGALPLLTALEDTETLKNSSQIKNILLRYCQATQPNYWLRQCRPSVMRKAAEAHDDAVASALKQVVHADCSPADTVARAVRQASLPIRDSKR